MIVLPFLSEWRKPAELNTTFLLEDQDVPSEAYALDLTDRSQ